MIKRSMLLLVLASLVAPTLSWAQSAIAEAPAVSTTDAAPEATHSAPQIVPPIPEEIMKIGALSAKFDKLNGICNTWNIGCMTVGDTITRDEGGVRSWLAKRNIGVIGLAVSNFGYNFLQAPQNPQVYNDEKPDWGATIDEFVTYNVPSKKMQFLVGTEWLNSSYSGIAGPNIFRIVNAYLYQSLLNGRLSYTIGYMGNDTTVYGGYIAGNLATGTLGVNAVIPYEIGMAFNPFDAPTVNVKYQFKNGLYGIAAVQRSIDPRGVETDIRRDQAGFRLLPHGIGALYMPEIGYKKAAAPGKKEVWVRATGWYNSSHYQDYSSPQDVLTGVKGHNGAASLVFEQQITQPDKYLPYRGIYWTATTQWASPHMNVYQQYYQVALYAIGLSRKRPLDMMILNVNRTQFSRTVLNTFEQLPHSFGAQLGVSTFDDATAVSGTYGYHLLPGTILTGMLAYTRHPAFAPKLDNPFTGKVQITMFW